MTPSPRRSAHRPMGPAAAPNGARYEKHNKGKIGRCFTFEIALLTKLYK